MNYKDYLLDQIKSSFLNTYPKLYVVSRTCPQAFVILYNTETQSPILILTQSFAGGVIISISTPSSVTILHATQQINTKNNANLLMFSKAIFSFFKYHWPTSLKTPDYISTVQVTRMLSGRNVM